MNLTEVLTIVAPLLALGAQLVIVVSHYTRTKEKADSACRAAKEAKDIAVQAHSKIEAQAAGIAAFRETIARQMVDRDGLREAKDEIMKAIGRLSARVDRLIDGHGTDLHEL